MKRLLCMHLLVNAVLISAGAATAYRGADNRLSGYDERNIHDRTLPEIEYHYPDDHSLNQIATSSQGLSPSSRYVTEGLMPPPSRRQPTRIVGQRRSKERRKQVATSTAEVYRTSQWGTARIPYRGAVVNVRPNRGRQRSYRGTVTTTILNPESVARLKSSNDDIGRSPVHDQPAMDNQPCYRCPSDKAVVAARSAQFVLLEKPLLKPCHQRSWSPEVKFELIGARAGSALHEGSHIIHGHIVYRQQTLQTCQFRYTVIVHRCPTLAQPPGLVSNCSASNAWGSECLLSCSAGLHPLGPTSTACGDRMRWTQPLPRCIAVAGCTLPPSPEHGRLSCSTAADQDVADLVPEGTRCRYVCGDGYNSGDREEIVCRGGEWSGTIESTCKETPNVRDRHPHRHRKHRIGPGRKNDPCQPNPCGQGGQCVAGPHAALALCSCPPELNREDESCHNVVLVERLRSKDRRRNKHTTVIGHVYAKRGPIIPAIYENGA